MPDVLRATRPAGSPSGSTRRSRELAAGGARTRTRPSGCSARTVVDLYHGAGAGEAAEAEFDRVFKQHDGARRHARRSSLPSGTLPGRRPASRRRSRRRSGWRVPAHRRQGGVRLDGERVTDPTARSPPTVDGTSLQVGKRNWARVEVVGYGYVRACQTVPRGGRRSAAVSSPERPRSAQLRRRVQLFDIAAPAPVVLSVAPHAGFARPSERSPERSGRLTPTPAISGRPERGPQIDAVSVAPTPARGDGSSVGRVGRGRVGDPLLENRAVNAKSQ